MKPISGANRRRAKHIGYGAALLLLLCLLFMPPFSLAGADAPGSRVVLAEYLQKAKELLAAGQAEEAWQMLGNLVREEPDSLELNSLMAEAAFASGRDNQALGALERMVSLYPYSAKLRMNLARAYARSGDMDSARQEMAEAEALEPGISSREEQAGMEKAARAEQRRHDRVKTGGRLAMGAVWDSNPTGGLDSRDIDLGPFIFHLDDDAGKKPSWGEYLNGSVNWGAQLGETAPFYLAGDIAFYGKKFERDLPSNRDFKWAKATAGPRYMSRDTLVDARLRLETAVMDPKDRLDITGADLSWVYGFLPGMQLIAGGGLESRTWMDRDERDGTYWNAGAHIRYFPWQSGEHSIMAGGRLLGADAREDRWSYDGWEGSLRADSTFFGKLDISPYLTWREYRYHAPATVISEWFGEENRRDHTLSAGVQAAWNWTDHLATEIGWEYSKNHSSSQFYRYEQQQVNVGMSLSF